MWVSYSAFLALLIGLHVRPGGADNSNQCYVCVPRGGGSSVHELAEEFNTSADKLPLCEDFSTDRNAPQFKRRCPGTFMGCLTQTNLENMYVTHTCANMVVEDCKVANNIRYCYCKQSLCNGIPAHRASTPPTAPAPAYFQPSDDEDSMIDHSGGGALPPDRKIEQPTRKPSLSAVTTAVGPVPPTASAAPITRTLKYFPNIVSIVTLFVIVVANRHLVDVTHQ